MIFLYFNIYFFLNRKKNIQKNIKKKQKKSQIFWLFVKLKCMGPEQKDMNWSNMTACLIDKFFTSLFQHRKIHSFIGFGRCFKNWIGSVGPTINRP